MASSFIIGHFQRARPSDAYSVNAIGSFELLADNVRHGQLRNINHLAPSAVDYRV